MIGFGMYIIAKGYPKLAKDMRPICVSIGFRQDSGNPALQFIGDYSAAKRMTMIK